MNDETLTTPEVPSILEPRTAPVDTSSSLDAQGRYDVQSLVSVADTPPDDAIKYLAGAKKFNTTPEGYQVLSEQFAKVEEESKHPTHASIPVAREMATTREAASVVKEDLPALNANTSLIKYQWENIQANSAMRRRNDILDKDLSGEKLTMQDRIDLRNIENEINDHYKNMEAYHANAVEKGAAGIVDFAQSLKDTAWASRYHILSGGAVGAGIGLATSGIAALGGPPGLLMATGSMAANTARGMGWGFITGSAADSFRETRAGVYAELRDDTKRKKAENDQIIASKSDKPLNNILPDKEARYLAEGVGNLSGALSLIALPFMGKTVPWLRNLLTPKSTSLVVKGVTEQAATKVTGQVLSESGEVLAGRTLMDRVEDSGLRPLLTAIGKSSLAMGGVSGTIKSAEILAKAMADSYDSNGKLIGSKENFIASMENVWANAQKNAGEVAASTVKGMAGGALFTTSMMGVGKIGSEFFGAVDKWRDNRPGKEVQYYTPGPSEPPPPSEPGPYSGPEGSSQWTEPTGQIKNPPQERPVTPTVNRSDIPDNVRGTQATMMAAMFRDSSTITKNTLTNEHMPDAVDRIRQADVEAITGQKGVWVEPEEVATLKSVEARNILDPSGRMAKEVNSPIWVTNAQFMRAVDADPAAAELVKPSSTSISAARFKLHMSEAEKQRRGIVEATGKPTIDPAAESPVTTEPAPTRLMRDGADTLGIVHRIKTLTPETVTLVDNTKIELRPEMVDVPAETPSGSKFTDSRAGVVAYIDGKKVGHLAVGGEFQGEGENKKFVTAPFDLSVDPNVQRKGIATAMSQYVDKHIARLNPSKMVTEQGQLFQKAIVRDVLGNLRTKSSDIFGEDDWLNQHTFTPSMEVPILNKEIEKFNATQTKIRLNVAQTIQDDVAKQMDRVVDLETRMNMVAEQEYQKGELANDRHTQIVEDFLDNSKEIGELSPFQEAQKKNGRPIYAINPATLDPEIRNKYESNKELYRRGVFNPNGVDVNDALVAFGVKDADTLLNILANSPTTKESVDVALKFNEAAIKHETEMANVDFAKTKSAEAINKAAQNHLDEANFWRNKYWPVTAKMTRRIALPTPKLPELEIRARNIIRSTPVKMLDANQYFVAERRHQRAAIDANNRHEYELALREKEKAAMSLLLAKETRIAIGEYNKMAKWVADLGSEDKQAILKQAGKTYQDAVNYFLDVYNFDPRQKGQSKIDAYQKYINEMQKRGQDDYMIPEEVMKWLTPRASAEELTVDQMREISNALRRQYKMATLKNKFSAKFKSDSPLEIIANELATSLENHPKFDAKKANKDINLLSARTLESFIQNIRSFLVMLDNGQQHGPFATMGWEPLQGMGQFEGPYGIISRAKMGASIRESVKKYRKKYGKVLADLGVQKVFVEEYKDIAALENGKLTKLDLYRMQALTGTAHNIAILQNLGVDIATIRAVNEKHLSKELFDIIQELHWGTFAKLRPLAFNEHELRTGEKPTAQESVSFEAFGQTYPGGYHHLVTKRDTEAAFLKARHEEMEASFGGTERVKLPFRSTVQSYVRSPHTINVVDHDLIPDLDVDMFAVGVENTIYALTMSNPVRDVITLFTHPELAQAIRSVSGPEQYRTFINNLQATTLSMQTHNEMQHSMQQRAFGEFVGKHLVTPFYLAVAAFSPAIAVKHLGLFEVARQIMGSGGTKHLTFAVGHWLKLWNLNKWSEMNKFISSAVPGHMDWSSGMSKTDSVLRDLNPKDYKYQNKPWKVMADVQEYLAHAGVHGFLGGLLHLTQNIVATAAMNQYLAGEAPGGPTKEQLDTMSDADVIREAKAYMGSVTVASSIEPQKTGKTTLNQIPIMKEAGRFTSITQNILNFINQRARNIHSDAKGGEKAWREGNYEESYAKFASSGQKTMNLFLFFMIMKMIENKGTGKQAFATDQNDKNKEEDLEGLLKFATHYTSLDGSLGLGELAVTGTVGMAPMGRNVIWAAEKGNGFGEVTMPFLSAVSTYGGAAKTLLMVPESLSFLDYIDRLSWYEYQQVAIAGSMITGMPLYAAMSMMKKTDNGQGPRRIEVAGDIVLGGALMAVDAFAGKHGTKTDKQKMQEIIDRRNEAKSQTATPTPTPTSSNEPKDKMQFVADAAVKTVENVIPKSTPSPLKIRGFNEKEYYEVVAQAESGDGKSMGSKGNWEATKRWMKTKNRPRGEWVGKPGVTEDRAYGPFQFMAKTWRGVVESVEGKAAGLTINGRFDDVQQLAAMKILTAQNIRSLKSNGIPITDQSVYAAHHFGDRVAAQTYATDAKDSDLLPSWVITKKVAKRNKDVADAETVGDLKEYIISRLGDGITKREAALKEDKNYQDVIKRTEILAAGRYKHEPAKQKPTVVRGRGR